MKIICVCGMGLGSSLILKMSVETALKQLGIKDADVEHVSAGTMEGLNHNIIVTAEDFRDEFPGRDDVVFVRNVVKADEVKAALEAYMKAKGLL